MSWSFSQVGGVRIGWWVATIPYAVLSANEEALCISSFGHDYVFLKQSITSLRMSRGIFHAYLRIKHTVPTYPRYVGFGFRAPLWSSRFAQLKEKLEALGYEVPEREFR